MLTPAGLRFAETNRAILQSAKLERKPQSSKERNWQRRERERMLTSDAFAKFTAGRQDAISTQEAESFFRVDAYVTGGAREEKILRARNAFGDDPDLGHLIKMLASMITKGGNQ